MQNQKTFDAASITTLALRLVVGWTYFSAFWRRLILENKLIPDEAGYIGEKFNHFLPNSLGLKPIIEYLVTHPEALWISMVAFTIIEGIVGLAMILGFFTRLMSIGIFLLALGILLASGWIGTTCLDEWQIGILGLAAGFSLFLTGSSYLSLDSYFIEKLKIPSDYVNGFKYFIVDDKALVDAVNARNKTLTTFVMGNLAEKYLKLLNEK